MPDRAAVPGQGNRQFERPKPGQTAEPITRDPGRADFWLIRAWLVAEFALCLGTGHILAWLIQFFLTLWFNTFLVVASHDFEESVTEDELAVIPVPLRNDWAAQQICLSYDLSVVGNRWIDLFLSAGLSPHRVHHVLPWHGSGFANLASEATVREVCAEVGIAWERPRNLMFERFPAVMKHYLLLPKKPAPPRSPAMAPPDMLPGQPPPPPRAAARRHAAAAEHAPRAASAAESAPWAGARPSSPPPNMQPPDMLAAGQPPAPRSLRSSGNCRRVRRAPLTPQPLPPDPVRVQPRSSVRGELGELFRYTLDGFRGVGV